MVHPCHDPSVLPRNGFWVLASCATVLAIVGLAACASDSTDAPSPTASSATTGPTPTSFEQVRDDQPEQWQADAAYGPTPSDGDDLLLNHLGTGTEPVVLPALGAYQALVVSVACEPASNYAVEGLRAGQEVVNLGSGYCGDGPATVHRSEPLDAAGRPDSVRVRLSGSGTWDVLVHGRPIAG